MVLMKTKQWNEQDNYKELRNWHGVFIFYCLEYYNRKNIDEFSPHKVLRSEHLNRVGVTNLVGDEEELGE